MMDQAEINAAHSREHWPDYARCTNPLCAPNPFCDDYINGQIIENPDYYVECMRPGCFASTPNVETMDEAKAVWDEMIAAIRKREGE